MSQLPTPDEKNLLADLAVLFPITSLLQIGACFDAQVQFYSDLGAVVLTFADGDEARVEKFNLQQSDNLSVNQVVLSPDGCKSQYYTASLPTESGLIKPENLQSIWQNIATIDECPVQTSTLDAFVSAQGICANWMFLNTVAAPEIMKGADQCLQSVDVVIAHSVLEVGENATLCQYSKDIQDARMFSYSFIAYAQLSTRHPAIARTVYVKDWKTTLQENLSILDSRSDKELAKRQAEIDRLQLQKDRSDDELAEEVSRREETIQRVTDAKSQQQLSDNNLQDLRTRYKSLAKSYKGQADIIKKIEAQLLAAQIALTESDDSTKTVGKKTGDDDE